MIIENHKNQKHREKTIRVYTYSNLIFPPLCAMSLERVDFCLEFEYSVHLDAENLISLQSGLFPSLAKSCSLNAKVF